MAASLLAQFQGLGQSQKSTVIILRCMSGVNRKRNGREAWHARKVPSGDTQFANELVKTRNKKIWGERQDYVNKRWRQTLLDVSANQGKLEAKVAESEIKLFMVRRVRPLAGCPYWEKEDAEKLNLKDKDIQIIENTEQNCAILKKLKHVVQILPITFPYGLPESEEDLQHCILCDNGEFIFTKRIHQSSLDVIETTDEIPENKWQISQEVLDKTLEHKKQLFQIHQEYYPTVYHWKRNEDGKEMRYKGNWNIGFDRTWY